MQTRLKVLVLAQYFPPDMGGASARASNVVKGLLGKDCLVKVVAAFPHYPYGDVPKEWRRMAMVSEKVSNPKILRVWIPSLPHNSIVNRIILHVCFIFSSLFALPFVGEVDVVWAASPNLFSFLPAMVYSFVKRKPIVRNVDDLWPEVFYELGLVHSKLMRKVLDLLARVSYSVPAAITPISAGYKRRINETYGVYASKIHVIEVGVDRVEPLGIRRNKKGQFVIMYSGVLGLGYDFDTVLDAASRLVRNKKIVFVIRGVGELAVVLRSQVRERNLKNVVLDTRFLPREKLSALLGSADAFVLPMACSSLVDEGLPTKVFEYQAYGKPIICVSSGEPARYVEATASGLAVKPGDAAGFAEVAARLYKDRKFAAQLGWNGWRHVSENLTVEKIGSRMYEVLASVTNR